MHGWDNFKNQFDYIIVREKLVGVLILHYCITKLSKKIEEASYKRKTMYLKQSCPTSMKLGEKVTSSREFVIDLLINYLQSQSF